MLKRALTLDSPTGSATSHPASWTGIQRLPPTLRAESAPRVPILSPEINFDIQIDRFWSPPSKKKTLGVRSSQRCRRETRIQWYSRVTASRSTWLSDEPNRRKCHPKSHSVLGQSTSCGTSAFIRALWLTSAQTTFQVWTLVNNRTDAFEFTSTLNGPLK